MTKKSNFWSDFGSRAPTWRPFWAGKGSDWHPWGHGEVPGDLRDRIFSIFVRTLAPFGPPRVGPESLGEANGVQKGPESDPRRCPERSQNRTLFI